MADSNLTAARLRELLHYDPETGIFTSRIDRIGKGCRVKAGDLVGGPHNRGYWKILLGGKDYLAHRLAWLYMTGEWPIGNLDHRDANRVNNRFGNLREASYEINAQNRRHANLNNKAGMLGVTRKGNRYRANICAGGLFQQIGTFATPPEAQAAYLEAKRRLHAGCTI